MKTRQVSIDLLKGRLTNQITSFKETITKVLDKDVSLAEKIKMLFWEQGITITSMSWLLVWLSVFWLKHCFLVVLRQGASDGTEIHDLKKFFWGGACPQTP